MKRRGRNRIGVGQRMDGEATSVDNCFKSLAFEQRTRSRAGAGQWGAHVGSGSFSDMGNSRTHLSVEWDDPTGREPERARLGEGVLRRGSSTQEGEWRVGWRWEEGSSFRNQGGGTWGDWGSWKIPD